MKDTAFQASFARLTRDSVIDGGECALVYGAAANLLSFVVPLLHRSSDASLAFAVLTQWAGSPGCLPRISNRR